MELVYLFCESGNIRIPFFGDDKDMFGRLASNGGKWDKSKNEFVFGQGIYVGNIREFFPGIPLVQVEENTISKPYTIGFFGRPWKNSGNESFVSSTNQKNDLLKSACMPDDKAILNPPRLPEKFPIHWQAKLETELHARKYSLSTVRAYLYYNRLICKVLQKTPEEIYPDDITQFLAALEKDKEQSASSVNLAISSIKFFQKNVLKNKGKFNINSAEQHRPRQDKRLPHVFSKAEIKKIIDMEKNPKHRLLLMLVYSSGLRVSEVVALKKEHIDLPRKLIYVRQGKGRKDRCTLLSERAAAFFSEYCSLYNIENWLFPGQPATNPLSIRSAQNIFEKAVRRAEIPRKTSIHSLRHTFATHLLESGTDIRYIQSLLGHSNLRTTERYTHIARRNILSIPSPLDCIE